MFESILYIIQVLFTKFTKSVFIDVYAVLIILIIPDIIVAKSLHIYKGEKYNPHNTIKNAILILKLIQKTLCLKIRKIGKIYSQDMGQR